MFFATESTEEHGKKKSEILFYLFIFLSFFRVLPWIPWL